MFPVRRLVTLVSLLLPGLLSGCLGAGSQVTRFYVLSPVSIGETMADAAAPAGLSVEVGEVRVPRYLDRPQLVSRSADNQLHVAEYHQWGGDLGKDMGRVLAQNLSRLLNTSNVSSVPYRPAGDPVIRLDMDVMQFEPGPDDQVHLSVQWRLSRGRDGHPLTSRVSDLQATGGVDAPGARVAAMSRLLGQLSREIARAVLEQAGAGD